MFRLLWFILLGYLLFKLVQSLLNTFAQKDRGDAHKAPAKGEPMVKDPQCGTYVPRSEALTVTRDGKVYHFCSPECRDRFLSKI